MDNLGFDWDELLPKIYVRDEEDTPMEVDEETDYTRNVRSLLPPESMDDIELKSIQLQFPNTLQLNGADACAETRVHTDRGDLMVAVQGDRTKPAILTYHDIGLNYTSFQTFFNFVDMRALMENFCVYHVNAPGQEDGAPTLPEDYLYPTMEELAHQISFVLVHFGIKSFIGVGVGAGAHILARFALINPTKVDALMLVNCTSTAPGWLEWASHKLNSRSLRSRGMTAAVVDYLVWHHLGRSPEERNPDVAANYRSYFSRNCNPGNLAMFIECYGRRIDLGIARDSVTLRPPVLNLAGGFSPMVDDTVVLNARLDPAKSTWMKLSDSALPLEEQPATVSQAFRLFLQGEGYATHALMSVCRVAAVLALHRIGTSHASSSGTQHASRSSADQ
ncbi:protein NDRG3-like isoform X2 [Maniola jurtina]|uniref:protein NDRG3-like isoform X2 n=1 Tax=Maniola jurtina TaxID=191418 RepID=UPI001E687ED9|nr:protein NDRG3-like isoform X2 [Maniola jurtina]